MFIVVVVVVHVAVHVAVHVLTLLCSNQHFVSLQIL